MCSHTVFYGRAGLVVMAISGVDLALWDLRGKALGQSVAQLLRADVDLGRRIPAYATVWNDKATQQAIQEGFGAVKLHVERFGARPDIIALRDLTSRVRRSLGDRGLLMLDAFGRWDVDSTVSVAQSLREFNLAWIEEPLPPDRYAEYAALGQASPVPIAGGEHEYLVTGFRRLIDERLHAVLQPDINWCGGMTTLVEVYRLAKQAGLRVCPHRGCEPYALHAIAALDDQPLAESPRTWFNCLRGAPKLDRGWIQLTDQPGFGVVFAND
jgi:L-alanine-DL-glutamate epimerase-like enolase superfamily enzyme